MIDIHIEKEFQKKIQHKPLLETAENTLTHLSLPPTTDLSIQIATDQEIRTLNRKYRQVDRETDVLAFPAGHINPEDGTTYLGDIIISYPRAQFQAEQRGHSPIQEIQLLIIHGILHLYGFDHTGTEEKQAMWKMKHQILTQLGIDTRILEDL